MSPQQKQKKTQSRTKQNYISSNSSVVSSSSCAFDDALTQPLIAAESDSMSIHSTGSFSSLRFKLNNRPSAVSSSMHTGFLPRSSLKGVKVNNDDDNENNNNEIQSQSQSHPLSQYELTLTPPSSSAQYKNNSHYPYDESKNPFAYDYHPSNQSSVSSHYDNHHHHNHHHPHDHYYMAQHQHHIMEINQNMQGVDLDSELARERAIEISTIHGDMRQIKDIYQDLASIVSEQQSEIDDIESHAMDTHSKVEKGVNELEKASVLADTYRRMSSRLCLVFVITFVVVFWSVYTFLLR